MGQNATVGLNETLMNIYDYLTFNSNFLTKRSAGSKTIIDNI